MLLPRGSHVSVSATHDNFKTLEVVYESDSFGILPSVAVALPNGRVLIYSFDHPAQWAISEDGCRSWMYTESTLMQFRPSMVVTVGSKLYALTTGYPRSFLPSLVISQNLGKTWSLLQESTKFIAICADTRFWRILAMDTSIVFEFYWILRNGRGWNLRRNCGDAS
jgi:hypothetical protein